MSTIQAIILGLIQGVTEFFPVSSSAHLKIVKLLFHLPSSKELFYFDLVCHVGSLGALVYFFRKELVQAYFNKKEFFYFSLALAPLVPIYFFFKPIRNFFSEDKWLGIFLMVTAALLLLASFSYRRSQHKFKDVLLIGVMQSLALIPGLSRLGSTIAAARMRGWEVKEAVRFSFLLSIPAVLGGIFLETLKGISEGVFSTQLPLSMFLIGFMTSFFSGFFAVKWIYSITRKSLKAFAIYCFCVGLITIITLSL